MSPRTLLLCCIILAGCGGPAEDRPAGVISNVDGQDGICSTGTPLLNSSQCTVSCCEAHDRCYVEHGCSAVSWLPATSSPECVQCNIDLLGCLSSGCDSTEDGRTHLERGARCNTSSECGDGDMCGDPDCDGVGACVPNNSGTSGTCCTMSNDCASSLCVQGHCAIPFGAAP